MNANYLRLSITDNCNLRCSYCVSQGKIEQLSKTDILSFEEMAEIVTVAAGLGVTTVRLTGGEPLLRRGIADLVAMISAVAGIGDVAITTNGVLLRDAAPSLKGSGLNRVNVSLDTLSPEKYLSLTGGDADITSVLEGIRAAVDAGLSPVKVNVVCLEGFNDEEVETFVKYGADNALIVRFIEFMTPKNSRYTSVPTSAIARTIEHTFGPITPVTGTIGAGPASYFTVPGAGVVGFISPLSRPSCADCNRLRLRADGKIYPCLMRPDHADLITALRPTPDRNKLSELLKDIITRKGSLCSDPVSMHPTQMRSIGG